MLVKKKISLGLLDYRPRLVISTICGFAIYMCIFFVTSTSFLVFVCFLFGLVVNWVVHYPHACTLILNNMILYEKNISLLIAIRSAFTQSLYVQLKWSNITVNPSAWSDGHCPHAARSHSFVYISTSQGANVIRLLRACS